jgi:hypothetical protein
MMYGYDAPICFTCNAPTEGKKCIDCDFNFCPECLGEDGRCSGCREEHRKYEASKREAQAEDARELELERLKERI